MGMFKSMRDLQKQAKDIEKTMPPQAPGSTTRAQALDIAAFILQFGKFKAGQADLSAANLAGISFPGTPRPARAAAGGVALAPTANLAPAVRPWPSPDSATRE